MLQNLGFRIYVKGFAEVEKVQCDDTTQQKKPLCILSFTDINSIPWLRYHSR